jgi:hypothetical protein
MYVATRCGYAEDDCCLKLAHKVFSTREGDGH